MPPLNQPKQLSEVSLSILAEAVAKLIHQTSSIQDTSLIREYCEQLPLTLQEDVLNRVVSLTNVILDCYHGYLSRPSVEDLEIRQDLAIQYLARVFHILMHGNIRTFNPAYTLLW